LPENSPLLERTEKTESAKAKKEAPKRKKRSKSGKNFTSDLDTLFEAALNENLKEKNFEDTLNSRNGRRSKRPPIVGLDALIQKTTDDNIDYTSTKKRVTFIFEKKKLDKLKRIAKLEKAYLKDIIGRIVGEHISKYDEDGKLR